MTDQPPPTDGQRIDWDSPPPGYVTFRIDAWPHDFGANGCEYVSACLPAAEVARWLRDVADRCDSWADPDCPWAGQPGHKPAPPPRDEEADRRYVAAEMARLKAANPQP